MGFIMDGLDAEAYDRTYSDRSLLRRILRYFQPQSRLILGAALLKRRTQAVKWVVGAHILHCGNCGAERTITAGRLSTVCPFCASAQVIEQDALDSIEQPDGLIPFTISDDAAKAALRERLRGFGE